MGAAGLEARHDGRPYICHSTVLLAVARRRHASGHLQAAKLVLLIIVAKASGTTRRFSLAIGTLLTPAPRARDDPGRVLMRVDS
jgi:hypothetical protein